MRNCPPKTYTSYHLELETSHRLEIERVRNFDSDPKLPPTTPGTLVGLGLIAPEAEKKKKKARANSSRGSPRRFLVGISYLARGLFVPRQMTSR